MPGTSNRGKDLTLLRGPGNARIMQEGILEDFVLLVSQERKEQGRKINPFLLLFLISCWLLCWALPNLSQQERRCERGMWVTRVCLQDPADQMRAQNGSGKQMVNNQYTMYLVPGSSQGLGKWQLQTDVTQMT